MYQYKESGLDNVWLMNGYQLHETEYGNGVSIDKSDQLHRMIGLGLVDSPAELTGAEFRFLRILMDLSQRRLANLINADEQAVRRWEKNRTKQIKGAAERMIRVCYKAFIDEKDKDIRQMIERLADLDSVVGREKLVFQETPSGWRPEASS